MVELWTEELVAKDPSGEPVINVASWFSRLTLEIVGQGTYILHYILLVLTYPTTAGFNYSFDAFDLRENPLRKAYSELLYAFIPQLDNAIGTEVYA